MSSSKAHEQWVDDQLHSILGAAQRTIRMFVISKSRSAKSSSALASDLRALGFPDNQQTTTFASQLLDRFATKKQPSAYETQHREAVRAAALNARLNTLEDEDPAPPAAPTTDARTPPDTDAPAERSRKHKEKKSKSRKRDRKRRDEEEGEEGEDDTAARLQRTRDKPRWQLEEEEFDQEEDEEARRKREEEEAERAAREAEEADRKERDDFAERLRHRDEEERARRRGGKHVEEDHDGLADKLDLQNKAALVSQLRLLSEQVYLEKRQEKELTLLMEAIEDEKRMFGNAPLTRQEREENAVRERILAIASEIKRSHEAQAEDTYHLPQTYDKSAKGLSDRQKLLKARYKDDKPSDEGTPWGEQEELEQAMLQRTGARAAAAGAAAGVGGAQEQFDLVFEDQIDFVNLDAIAGDDDLSSSEDEEEKERKAAAAVKQTERERIRTARESLPSYAYRQQFLDAVYKHQVLIIVAETGAGKTTQLPQYLLEEGFGKAGIIGCTQPRRVAAMSVAARVAEEMDVRLGREVGYSIRFEDNTSDKTVVKYMTDGMLLREFLTEPTLKEYSVMIVDEAHERTLHTDILFGLVKDITKVRPEFKLLISSATLDAEKFSNYFGGAPIFSFPGRRYPVDIYYTAQPEADYIEAAVVTVLQIHVTQEEGDVLVFLTGQEEIEACEELLKQRTRGFGSKIKDLEICPIYANLPTELQAKIFEPTPPGCRKVVLATNIAETSLTIDGIKYVIDPGFHKINSFSPKTGMESLQVVPVSQASANQRAGRAGRTSAGKCFRLYTQWSYQNDMEESTVPEIQRTNLASVALLLKSLGINNVVDFDFMDRPPTEALLKAFEQLYALGALNSGGDLTKLGRRMAEFPTDPQLAKTILAAEPLGCAVEIATVAAMVSVGSAVFYAPKDKKVIADNARRNFYRGVAGDHAALLAVFRDWAETEFSSQWCMENYVQLRTMKRARDIREQLVGLMERVEISMESCGDDDVPVRKALTAGYFYNAAQLSKPTEAAYKTVKQRHTVYIHPGSGVKENSEGMLPEYVVYHELVLTSKQYMRTVSEIDGAWLRELAPHFYSEKDVADKNKKAVKGKGRSAAEPS